MAVRNIAFFYITWSVFAELICRKQIFCLYGFLRSYAYGKIRVRLMRTEGDGNENEGHFVSVGARLAALPRGWGGGVYVACFITAMWQKLLCCVVRFASALVLMSVAALLLVAGMGGLFLLFFSCACVCARFMCVINYNGLCAFVLFYVYAVGAFWRRSFWLSFFPCKAGLFGKNPMPKND